MIAIALDRESFGVADDHQIDAVVVGLPLRNDVVPRCLDPQVHPLLEQALERIDEHRRCDDGRRLSDIGGRRTAERLQQALVAPDAEVLPENRFVGLVTREGVVVSGRLLNQDAISVQLINAKDELKSYLKAGLREYAIIDKGLMPSVQGTLTDAAVADIVTYLSSLKGT